MLQGIRHLRPTHPRWEGPEDIPFTHIVRNTFMRGALASLKISVVILLCGPKLLVGTVVSELGNPAWRGQVATLHCQGKAGMVAVMDNKLKEAIRIV